MHIFYVGKSNIAQRYVEVPSFYHSRHKTGFFTPGETYKLVKKCPVLQKSPGMMIVHSHNSYLVSVSAIRKMNKDDIEQINNKTMPISHYH